MLTLLSDVAAVVVLKTPLSGIGAAAQATGLSADVGKAALQNDSAGLAPNFIEAVLKPWLNRVWGATEALAQRAATAVGKFLDKNPPNKPLGVQARESQITSGFRSTWVGCAFIFYYSPDTSGVKETWGWILALGYGLYVCVGVSIGKPIQLAATTIRPGEQHGRQSTRRTCWRMLCRGGRLGSCT